MELRRYLNRLHDTLHSRQDLVIEHLYIEEVAPGREGLIEGRLRFWDGSLLSFVETLIMRGVVLVKTDYAYHYQDAAAHLILRYDNAPHHPEVATHPHHKHVAGPGHQGELIEAAPPPQLHEVLQEIERHLYSSEAES